MSAPAATASATRYGDNSVLRAVGYMCLASLFFPILNASVKYLGQRYPITEVFFARYLGHCVICLALFLPRHGRQLFATSRPGLHGLRAVLLFCASAFYFLGIQTIDLSTAAAISFAGPIFAGLNRIYGSASFTAVTNSEFVAFITRKELVSANPVV